MKIVINTDNYEIINSVIRAAKEHGNIVNIARLEKALFEHIESEEVDAFIITANTSYAQRAVDYIKRELPYTPVILIGNSKTYSITSADIIMPFEPTTDIEFYCKSILHNIYVFNKNFEKLQKLTAKIGNIIEVGNCTYDPNRRLLFHKGVQVHKLSPKQAGIFETLADNFREVVLKEVILQKVWQESNYFVGRSLDVFVTHLRKILKNNNINMTITAVTAIGLMLDYTKDDNV